MTMLHQPLPATDTIKALLHHSHFYSTAERHIILLIHAHFALYQFVKLDVEFAEEGAWTDPIRSVLQQIILENPGSCEST